MYLWHERAGISNSSDMEWTICLEMLALVCPAVNVHISAQAHIRPEVEVVETEEQPGLLVLLHPDPQDLVPAVQTKGTEADREQDCQHQQHQHCQLPSHRVALAVHTISDKRMSEVLSK